MSVYISIYMCKYIYGHMKIYEKYQKLYENFRSNYSSVTSLQLDLSLKF